MRNVRRVLLAIFMVLVLLIVLAFVLENQQPASLVFLGWIGPQLPVSVIAMVALLIGMLIGPILGWLRRRLVRKRLSRSS